MTVMRWRSRRTPARHAAGTPPPPCPCCPPDLDQEPEPEPAASLLPPSRMAGADPRDPRDVATDEARQVLAPPPLPALPDGTMIAVAGGPGPIPEEWQGEGAWPFWYAYPHAAGAVHAGEMTAGQLRVCLALRDAILAREVTAAGPHRDHLAERNRP